jgi:hypothetical protein
VKFMLKTVINNLEGEPFKDRGPKNEDIQLTLGGAALTALLGKLPQDQGLPGNIKILHWELAKKIKAGVSAGKEFVEIPTEHLSLLKNRILQVFDTHVAGPICDVIEGDSGCQVVPMIPGE